jgi:Resolvase, N terminal domain
VTQQFNTTPSMGRLTLNMLLSFAQFEREIAGERIRDKIAASKAKGMWMGGNVPLGYDVKDRKLVVNEAEAATVRMIFRRYTELGSVALLKAELPPLAPHHATAFKEFLALHVGLFEYSNIASFHLFLAETLTSNVAPRPTRARSRVISMRTPAISRGER